MLWGLWLLGTLTWLSMRQFQFCFLHSTFWSILILIWVSYSYGFPLDFLLEWGHFLYFVFWDGFLNASPFSFPTLIGLSFGLKSLIGWSDSSPRFFSSDSWSLLCSSRTHTRRSSSRQFQLGFNPILYICMYYPRSPSHLTPSLPCRLLAPLLAWRLFRKPSTWLGNGPGRLASSGAASKALYDGVLAPGSWTCPSPAWAIPHWMIQLRFLLPPHSSCCSRRNWRRSSAWIVPWLEENSSPNAPDSRCCAPRPWWSPRRPVSSCHCCWSYWPLLFLLPSLGYQPHSATVATSSSPEFEHRSWRCWPPLGVVGPAVRRRDSSQATWSANWCSRVLHFSPAGHCCRRGFARSVPCRCAQRILLLLQFHLWVAPQRCRRCREVSSLVLPLLVRSTYWWHPAPWAIGWLDVIGAAPPVWVWLPWSCAFARIDRPAVCG